ncbi:DUF3500 domain-containing protein [Streptomyces coffeae]|uniref:DUF3500 domain-containing protein n=1 Tax=Streptomyces coffeae TaxID=621382 RepID=A0ABS1NNM8_9ACTN|nr:DUF3500 domain-containing protein [Streptomyces coffeae]MBL1101512.1 DUF3500 domain-containing protein [Streptomyces coffeae]
MAGDFRDHLYPLNHPRLSEYRSCDPYSYVDALRRNPQFDEVLSEWSSLFETTEFQGITTDGRPVRGLFGTDHDEGGPAAPAADAARALMEALGPQDRERVQHPLDSRVWRAWMNPEIYLNRFGLRLEEVDEDVRKRVFELIATCLSPTGYRRVRDVMTVNGFLGELVDLPQLLNEHSYNINIFGTPSPTKPWGWNLWGHHLAVNCLLIGGRQVLTPVFFGSEPNTIDTGRHAGLSLFDEQECAGLAFVQTLTGRQADRAVLYHRKRDRGMPPARLHPGDELHLGGAFQDNRVIPYEGVRGTELAPAQQEALIDLVALFLDYQPDGPRQARMTDVRRHIDDTRFCWIGGRGDEDPFYYRVQSPVILVEFDHHAGVFLANSEPEKFHTHTIVRTPNGNDYGAELVRRATGSPHRLDGPV